MAGWKDHGPGGCCCEAECFTRLDDFCDGTFFSGPIRWANVNGYWGSSNCSAFSSPAPGQFGGLAADTTEAGTFLPGTSATLDVFRRPFLMGTSTFDVHLSAGAVLRYFPRRDVNPCVTFVQANGTLYIDQASSVGPDNASTVRIWGALSAAITNPITGNSFTVKCEKHYVSDATKRFSLCRLSVKAIGAEDVDYVIVANFASDTLDQTNNWYGDGFLNSSMPTGEPVIGFKDLQTINHKFIGQLWTGPEPAPSSGVTTITNFRWTASGGSFPDCPVFADHMFENFLIAGLKPAQMDFDLTNFAMSPMNISRTATCQEDLAAISQTYLTTSMTVTDNVFEDFVLRLLSVTSRWGDFRRLVVLTSFRFEIQPLQFPGTATTIEVVAATSSAEVGLNVMPLTIARYTCHQIAVLTPAPAIYNNGLADHIYDDLFGLNWQLVLTPHN